MKLNKKTYGIQYVILLIMIIFVGGCDTENNLDPEYKDHFVRFFGDQGNQEGVDLIVNESEQTVVLLGTTTEPGTSIKRIFLVKSDWEGNLIWKKKLGGPYDAAKDIELNNDGGFVILSVSSKDTQQSSGHGMKVLKVTAEGEKTDSIFHQFEESAINPINDFPITITPYSAGYIVTGSTEYETDKANGGAIDVSDVMRIFLTEDLMVNDDYTPTYSQSGNDYGIKTVLISQNFYSLSTSINTANNYDFWCFQAGEGEGVGFNFPVGNQASPNDEILRAVCPGFNSGGYFLVGTYSNAVNVSDIYIAYTFESDQGELKPAEKGASNIKIPLNTNRMITPTSVCQSRSDQSGYIIVGTEGEELEHNIWLCKVSEVGGKVLWSSVFGAGDRNDDRAGAVAELPDGKILVVGTVNLGVNNLKMGLFKLNNRGQFAK